MSIRKKRKSNLLLRIKLYPSVW